MGSGPTSPRTGTASSVEGALSLVPSERVGRRVDVGVVVRVDPLGLAVGCAEVGGAARLDARVVGGLVR